MTFGIFNEWMWHLGLNMRRIFCAAKNNKKQSSWVKLKRIKSQKYDSNWCTFRLKLWGQNWIRRLPPDRYQVTPDLLTSFPPPRSSSLWVACRWAQTANTGSFQPSKMSAVLSAGGERRHLLLPVVCLLSELQGLGTRKRQSCNTSVMTSVTFKLLPKDF